MTRRLAVALFGGDHMKFRLVPFIAVAAMLAVRPAGATIIDLTTATATHSQIADLGGGFTVQQISPQSTGTGVIDSFLRVQANGAEQGYNTDQTPPPLDAKAGNFTRSLLLSEVPVVGGAYQFLLDINQSGDGFISLNQIQLFASSVGLTSATSSFSSNAGAGTNAVIGFSNATQVFRMSNASTADPKSYTINMNYNLNSGSGSGDMFLFVDKSIFGNANPATTFVTLFSQFGNPPPTGTSSNDGFEEWSVLKCPATGCGGSNTLDAVPEPASLLLLGTGMAALAGKMRNRRKSGK